ncbi:VCBS domain-containing protein [Bradyrhizobium sp. Ai1a-2]|uniref:VCBS domain-containing protein n=1 Tax=Bradyrhizobium sp. Ai1a-2 TaxID=196490 RepID=UPI00041B7403|nr:VCBS domain-containing protein [Bradyrhizobium sp. Ai1a-2]
MFVASCVESGGDPKAVVAQLPRIIGHVQTAIGCCTLSRATGIAVQLIAGDPVYQGDVIETAADAQVGIRFIDGTVFNLSPGSCLVLNELICDSSGTSHSAVFGVTRGTFAFVAGRLAKTGCLTVDTPVGSIRGRAHAGGIGTLTLVALTFAAMKEVQAAEPDATYFDDDSIAYKDLEHGVFELVTKEPIPRHIIVEDPGETTILSKRGSSVSVSQTANSATRMEELHAAQQDVLANFAKEQGATGSSTPPTLNVLPVQRIDFIQTDTLPIHNSLQPLPTMVVPELFVVRSAPVLTVATGPTEIDTSVFDHFAATSGAFAANSSNGAALTFGISGGVAGSTVLGGVTYNVSSAGSYGRLYLNSATGAYTFVPDSAAINALTSPTTETFIVTVSDGTLSTNQVFSIAINGVNDAAIISGSTAGAVIEAGSAGLGMPAATGTLTDVDVDNPPNTFTVVDSPKASIGGYGTFTVTAAGVWTYTVNEANSAVQALNVGDHLTDKFTVTTVDGTAQVVTITIDGTNDAAIISGAKAGTVIEASSGAPGALTTTGKLTDSDVDNAPDTFTAVMSPTASHAGYGTFTMTAAGVWTYTLNDSNSAVQALNVGDHLTDTFTVTTADGTAQMVTITINGTNDAAVISGATAGCVIEAGGVADARPGVPTATGELAATDVDNPPDLFTAVISPKPSNGGYGTFTMTAAGVWTYTLDNTNAAVQALNVCDHLSDTFTVTSIDGTAQVVTITINGTNDAAVVSGATTGTVIEDGGAGPGTPIATGALADTDVDNTPNTFTAVCSPTKSDGGYGTFTMTAAGVWAYTLDNNNCTVQALDACDKLTDTFTVTTIDGTAQVVTITIKGASDADPNDFDYLATGSVVRCDPPYIYGTPGHDNIAGGGYGGQIVYAGAGNDTVNGTGCADTLYGGSGNDTIKGNDGDDTIYGGSGNDTINGNNGCDTIVGGFGADSLTGGNGNDCFVYLSVADSHAARFDTISDFRSGSDKINLTALGALALLALTSTSTSVPAHTIGWLYDSAANETVVYVNPTDQALSIGDSSLLEVHLQGIATIQASDFVPTPAPEPIMAADSAVDLLTPAATIATSADLASGSNLADGALPAGASASEAPTDVVRSFSIDGSQIDLTDHAGSISFGKAHTGSTEHASVEARTTSASGPPIHGAFVQIAASAESSFVFDQASAHDGTTATTIGQGAAMHGTGNPAGFAVPTVGSDKAGPALIEHGLMADGGGWIWPQGNDRTFDPATSSIDALNDKDHKELPTNAASIHAAETHDHASDGDANSEPPGVSEASEENGPAVASVDANWHALAKHGGHPCPGEAGKDDAVPKHGATDLAPVSVADEVFGAGPGGARLEHSFHFKEKSSGSDGFDLGHVDHDPASGSHRDDAAAIHGPEGTQAIEALLHGHHAADHFGPVSELAGSIVATHGQHDLVI